MCPPVGTPDIFHAISDPTRRALLDLLAGAEQPVSALVERFEVSQPAISQHLRVLRGAGLVSERRQGRHRLYRLEPVPLRQAYDWLAHYEGFWRDKLAALGEQLRQMELREHRRRPGRPKRRSN